MEDLTEIVIDENYDFAWDVILNRRAFNPSDEDDWTPMHAAALRDAHFLIRPLEIAGCSLTSFNKLGRTPIHIAASQNSTRFLRQVMDPELMCIRTDSEFESMPIHSAVTCGHFEAVEMLLDAGVDPDVRDFYGLTLVHYAVVWKDQVGMIEMLASRGALIDEATTELGSPLQCAIEKRRYGAALSLIELGADTNRTTSDGLSFAGLVHSAGWSGVIDY